MKMKDRRRTAYRRAYFRASTYDYGTQVAATAMVVIRGKKLLLIRMLSDYRPTEEIRKYCFARLVEHAQERGLL